MQLLDHFHPPLSTRRPWESFQARWIASIADALNEHLLPPSYVAATREHLSNRAEEVEGMPTARSWAPPEPAMRMPTVFPDRLEVLIFHTETGPTLVAAIELVSPGHKALESHRRAFAAKCSSYLQQGIGLVIVDIVTSQQANLHNALIRMLDVGEPFLLPEDRLYTIAYQPLHHPDVQAIDIWPVALAVGRELPLMPLPIHRELILPLNLSKTYAEACQRSRLSST